jgi:hypothetical protein
MLFTKKCQNYYYLISYLISMARYNVKRSTLALYINWATKHRMMLTPLVVYGGPSMVKWTKKCICPNPNF